MLRGARTPLSVTRHAERTRGNSVGDTGSGTHTQRERERDRDGQTHTQDE